MSTNDNNNSSSTFFATDVQRLKSLLESLTDKQRARLDDIAYLSRVLSEASFQLNNHTATITQREQERLNQGSSNAPKKDGRGRPQAINREVIWDHFRTHEIDRTLRAAKYGWMSRMASLFKITAITVKRIVMENVELARYVG